MILATTTPFPQYFDLDGDPLDNGSLYFGVVDLNPETAPITVYWDSAATQPAAQPIKTKNGFPVRNGTPTTVYATSGHSLTVRDAKGRLVFYARRSGEIDNTEALIAQLADTSSTANGDAMIGVKQPYTGAVARTQHDKNLEFLSVKDFGAVADGVTDDFPAIIATVKAAIALQGSGLSITIHFPDDHSYVSSGSLPVVRGIVYSCNSRWSASIKFTGSGAAFYTATYSGGVFTDNLDDTIGETSISLAGIRNLYIDHTGAISGNAGSGTPWAAAVQIVNAPHIKLDNIGVENKTNNIGGIYLKWSWRSQIFNPWVPRGGSNSGGYGILLDAQCNAILMESPYVFGAFAEGIRVIGASSVTITEPNVEFCTIGLRAISGHMFRVVGGYVEGNGKDVVIGSAGAAIDGWDLDRMWHNGSGGSTNAVEIIAGIHGRIYRPFFTGGYSGTRFLMTGGASDNYSNDIHLNVADASDATQITSQGLLGGRNRIHFYGDAPDDFRLFASYHSSDARPLETILNQAGHPFQCFEVRLQNVGGVLSVAIADGDEGSTNYSSCFIAQSTTLVAQSDVSTVAGFAANAGAGRLSGTNSLIVLNTHANVAGRQGFAAGSVRTNGGTAIAVEVRVKSRNINGVTQVRPEITLRSPTTDAPFDFDTVNFAAGEYVKIPIIGFIK